METRENLRVRVRVLRFLFNSFNHIVLGFHVFISNRRFKNSQGSGHGGSALAFKSKEIVVNLRPSLGYGVRAFTQVNNNKNSQGSNID